MEHVLKNIQSYILLVTPEPFSFFKIPRGLKPLGTFLFFIGAKSC